MNYYRKLLIFVPLGLGLASCQPKEESDSNDPSVAAQSDATISPKLEPTNPDGGTVDGRFERPNVEESSSRVQANMRVPIVFGDSAANISMGTSFADSLSILSPATQISQGMHFYDEGIGVIWGEEEPRTPQLIALFEGYLGALTFEQPVGDLTLGMSLKQYFTANDPLGTSLVRAMGRTFEGQEGTAYDCLEAKTCGVIDGAATLEFRFRKGAISISQTTDRKLTNVIFRPPVESVSFAPLEAVVDFNSGLIGTVGPGTSKTEAEILLDTPLGLTLDSRWVYDNGGVSVLYDGLSPFPMSRFFIHQTFQGDIIIPGLGTANMGQDFADHFTDSDPLGKTLLKDIGRALDGKAADPAYDCQRVQSCSASRGNGSIIFTFDRGQIVFNDSDPFKLALIMVNQLPQPRTDPLTDAWTYGVGAGGITLDTTLMEAEDILGTPRSTNGNTFFYDNGNLAIAWQSEAPNLPEVIQIDHGYEGALGFPASLGSVKMGSDFTAHFPKSDPFGNALVKTLGVEFLGEAAAYDCLAEETCEIEVSAALIFFRFAKGIVAFEKEEDSWFLSFIQITRESQLTTDQEASE